MEYDNNNIRKPLNVYRKMYLTVICSSSILYIEIYSYKTAAFYERNLCILQQKRKSCSDFKPWVKQLQNILDINETTIQDKQLIKRRNSLTNY